MSPVATPPVTDPDARPSATLAAPEGPQSLEEFVTLRGADGLRALTPQGVRLAGPRPAGLNHRERLDDDPARQPPRARARRRGVGRRRDLGPTRPRYPAGLDRRLSTVADRHSRPVTSVGSSLGGIFPRQVASPRLDGVRRVITIGSLCRLTDPTRSAAGARRRGSHVLAPMASCRGGRIGSPTRRWRRASGWSAATAGSATTVRPRRRGLPRAPCRR